MTAILLAYLPGSSPHGRGTLVFEFSGVKSKRFIPAWAGNSRPCRPRNTGRTVHPRMGGELSSVSAPITPSYGSSPHGRGTHNPQSMCAPIRRFIPAWAGNSGSQDGGLYQAAVHPRMGGELYARGGNYAWVSGSSPHGRGTRRLFQCTLSTLRFIPAWAGNSILVMLLSPILAVHPRMGGELF